MNQAAFQYFIEPLQGFFSDPPGKHADEFFAELAKDISRYPEPVLRRAVMRIRNTRKQRGFPSFAECREALEAEMPKEATRNPKSFHQYEAWTPARIRGADDLICCKLGVQACEQGWIGALHDFCREYERLPVGREIDDLRRQARQFDEAMINARQAGLLSAGQSIEARRLRFVGIVTAWAQKHLPSQPQEAAE